MKPVDDPADASPASSTAPARSSPSTNTGQISLLSAGLQAQRREPSRSPKSLSMPTANTSRPARCSSPALADERIDGTLRDLALDASQLGAAPPSPMHDGRRSAHRLHAHLAGHPDRRLVALCIRYRRRSLRLHQHADRRQTGRPALEVRRHHLRSRRPRFHARHPQRHAHVEQCHAVAEVRPHPEPRRASTRTDDIRPGLGYDGLDALQEVRRARAACSSPAKTPPSSPSTPASLPASASLPAAMPASSAPCSTRSSSRQDNPIAFGYGRQSFPSSAPTAWPSTSATRLAHGRRVLMTLTDGSLRRTAHRPRQPRRQRRAAGPQRSSKPSRS